MQVRRGGVYTGYMETVKRRGRPKGSKNKPREATAEQPRDRWQMSLPHLKELVGQDPVDVAVHNKHVVVSYGNNTRVLFKQW